LGANLPFDSGKVFAKSWNLLPNLMISIAEYLHELCQKREKRIVKTRKAASIFMIYIYKNIDLSSILSRRQDKGPFKESPGRNRADKPRLLKQNVILSAGLLLGIEGAPPGFLGLASTFMTLFSLMV